MNLIETTEPNVTSKAKVISKVYLQPLVNIDKLLWITISVIYLEYLFLSCTVQYNYYVWFQRNGLQWLTRWHSSMK